MSTTKRTRFSPRRKALLAFFALEYIRPGSYVPAFNALHLNTLVPGLIFAMTLFVAAPVSNQQAFATCHRFVGRVHRVEQHGELVTAEARSDVGAAKGRANAIADRGEDDIAGRVAIRVVDGLEVVEVDEHHAHHR